jgi:hypothetical protein
MLEYKQYKLLLLFWAMVDLLVREMWSPVSRVRTGAAAWQCVSVVKARQSWRTKILAQFHENIVQAKDLMR